MNPFDAIWYSPHRWWILAGLSLLTGIVGAMFGLAWAWPHWLSRGWFWLGAALALYFAVLGVIDWRKRLEESLAAAKRDLEHNVQ
jgi:hypothetical protein